jgi:hypothetical protein
MQSLELADVLEAEALRRVRRVDEQILERASTAAVSDWQPSPRALEEMPLSELRVRSVVDDAARRLARALECDETPAALRREQVAGVLRVLRDRGVFRRRLEAGA